ncbi:DUF2680 domain-containing protein [Selenihalanaerobacter shriftii]|uniref:Uncharacterized protein n=1 Tax=Selenihalanaerobacter shriftii TaxID=142842 RepID=A0A1T4JK13_9FIRM|nr:DUF2680 domain-containing protein [Selenihalanaerobacter shriftii]SJZ30468.1 Protein of unknown function [Selenihalanaerobacter shriftii]
MKQTKKILTLLVLSLTFIYLVTIFSGCSNKNQAQVVPDTKEENNVAKANQNDWLEKRYQFQKNYIQKQLKRDLITERQAEYMLERLNAMKNYYEEIDDNLPQKNYQFQKDYIEKQLEKGLITKAQADYMLAQLDTMKDCFEEYGQSCNSGMFGMMSGFSPMMHGPGMMNGYGWGSQGNQNFGPNMMQGSQGFGPGMMRGR